MNDLVETLEDLIVRLGEFDKSIAKLKTASVSRTAQRAIPKALYKEWLPVLGALEQDVLIEPSSLEALGNAWQRLVRLSEAASPRASYRSTLKTLIGGLETDVLHPLIKRSGLKTVGEVVRPLVASVTDPRIATYLDESIRCAENNCVRAAVVLAWCAVASRMHDKLLAVGLPQVEGEFDRMRQDQGILFRAFTRAYKFSSPPDLQEVPDAHLILLCRFLGWMDDSQYKQLKGALDLRNGCGHPCGYQPDAVKLQAYYADLVQLVLANAKFA